VPEKATDGDLSVDLSGCKSVMSEAKSAVGATITGWPLLARDLVGGIKRKVRGMVCVVYVSCVAG
jgi:hypothetical protein